MSCSLARAMVQLLASRRRVVLVTLGLLALLDAGRSVYARVAYARPHELWQPDPSQYADLAWPPSRAVPPGALPARRIYVERCAVCHGPDGRGNGPAAPSMIPRPRDFTLGQYKYKSTPPGQPPTDDDLYQTVANGLQDSGMPFWHDLLTELEVRAVVTYLKSLSPSFAQVPAVPMRAPPRVAADTASVARGRQIYATQGCAACHGADGRLQLTTQDAKGLPVIARDLTAPWTFKRGSAPEEIWIRLTTGLAPSPMPSYAGSTTPPERWDLVNYVLSLARVPPWEPGGAFGGRGFATDRVKRGEYLVRAEMCGLCHTQINRTGIYRDSMYLAGGMRVGAYPHGIYVSRNLTSDPETGLGRWSEAEIARAIRTGRTPTRTLSLWAMPWPFLHNLTEDDALAIGAYLKRLPPRRNQAPDALHFGFVETVVSKIVRGPPASPVTRLTYTEGNFSRATPGTDPNWQRVLVWAQWIVLALGITAFVVMGRRVPHGRRGWLKATAAALGVGLLAVIFWALYAMPTLSVIPPEQIAGPINAGIPRPNAMSLGSAERARMAERGRYLYSVAGCSFCHTPNGEGGFKLSWVAFGTRWVRNITSDSATGIGAWSDAEIARAIRGGVSADGRMLHWQAMIWDHGSNWDEEDTRALVAYLRTLPPVRREIPATLPPTSNDCAVYSFFIAERREPRCG